MKRWGYFFLLQLLSANVFGQIDTLKSIVYDTVEVELEPLVVTKQILYIAPKKHKYNRYMWGALVGANYHSSLYYTCKECEYYRPYADSMNKSNTPSPSLNVSLQLGKQIASRFFTGLSIQYQLINEKFLVEEVKAMNSYQYIGGRWSLYYLLSRDNSKNRFIIGLGGQGNYMLKASGRTLTIFQEQKTADISYRRFNPLLWGLGLSANWLVSLSKDYYLLINPDVAFDITSFTSYSEYYLQNRFVYSLNVGLVKEFNFSKE